MYFLKDIVKRRVSVLDCANRTNRLLKRRIDGGKLSNILNIRIQKPYYICSNSALQHIEICREISCG
ncbi:MAG: hypothetical protein OEV79_10560 [candidate division WOR-3 bacterium]|nr:hypothetical protein [candidate division WOR-3 bacterium]